MTDGAYKVLFLCTGNSARSVMAECLLRDLGKGKFEAFSAGSHPTGEINPYVRDLLENCGHETAHLHSKSWNEFAEDDAPAMDFVITVCDSAAGEVCPVWPGQPMSAHWPFSDPATFEGTEAEKRAFVAEVYGQIRRRLEIFTSLPIASLDRLSLKRRMDELGDGESQTETA